MSLKEVRLFRCLALGLLLGLIPALAHAQTDLDQGKSAAQMFSADCATCHKSVRGLANGRGNAALKSFLTEHYTSNNDQAAALAAYVLGSGGGDSPAAASNRTARPQVEHAGLPTEDSRPPRSTARSPRKGRELPASAKLQPPGHEEGQSPSIIQEEPASPQRRNPVARREGPPSVATHEPEAQPDTNPPPSLPPPAAVESTEPPEQPASGQEASPPQQSVAAPTNADSGDNTPVPRDNIPD